MKFHIFFVSSILVLLSACSQESIQVQAPIQSVHQEQSGGTLEISQATGVMLSLKDETKKEAIETPISADDCMKYVEKIANTTGGNASWMNDRYNECMARSAMESSEISFCMEYEFPNEDGVRLCVASMLKHLIERDIEKNGGVYQDNFCRDIVKQVSTPKTMGGAEIGNEHKLGGSNYIHDCYVTYASISTNVDMCQGSKKNVYTMELSNDPNVDIDPMSVDSCIIGYSSENPGYTKDKICSLLSQKQSETCKRMPNMEAMLTNIQGRFDNLLYFTKKVPSHDEILKKIKEAEQSLKQKKGKDSQYNDLLK